MKKVAKPKSSVASSARRSVSSKPAVPKRTYHHGDLRRALVDAAWTLVAEHGVSGLTLREVARKVGVTHAAPYHHFPTRTALLDALACEAFRALDAVNVAALARSEEPGERMFLLGCSYVDFAREHPEQLQVMFRRRNEGPDGEGASTEELQQVGDAAFGHLFHAVVACQAAGVAPAGDPFELALGAWSLVHGFSKLWVEGPLANMPPYADRFAALRDITLRGLVDAWRDRARAQQARR